MGNITIVEYQHERVLTTEQLAQVYRCKPDNLQDNFRKNPNRFTKGMHYFKLEGDILKTFKQSLPEIFREPLKYVSQLMLWTKRGASRHCKMLGTDEAWEQFDILEENYYNPKPQTVPQITTTTKPRYRQRMISTAIRDVAATAKAIMKEFSVSPGMAQATAFKLVEPHYCIDMTPVKKLIKPAEHETGWLTPTEIGIKMGGKKAAEINKMFVNAELQYQYIGAKGKKAWRLTEKGKNYGEEFPYDAKTGHSGYQIRWNESVISLLEKEGEVQ